MAGQVVVCGVGGAPAVIAMKGNQLSCFKEALHAMGGIREIAWSPVRQGGKGKEAAQR